MRQSLKNKNYQDSWKKLICNESTLEETSNLTGIDSETLDLYKGFVNNHYEGALEKMFPRLGSLIDIDWTEVSHLYFEKFPPYAWDLNDLTINFPTFALSYFDDFDFEEEVLKELLEYEINEFMVYKMPTSEIPFSNIYTINDAVFLAEYQFDIASWVKQMDKLEIADDIEKLKSSRPLKAPNILCVSRNPATNLCVFTQFGALELGIVEVLKQVNVLKGSEDSILHFLKELLPSEICDQLSTNHIKSVITKLIGQSVIL